MFLELSFIADPAWSKILALTETDRDMDSTQAISALSALAQDTRLSIFRLLVARGPDGMPAGAIGEALGVPASSLSFHLAHLTRAGLLSQKRESRSLIYAADITGMNALIGFLTSDCCGGNPALCIPPAAAPACGSGSCNLDPSPVEQFR
jgi:DNA-binding transcriptional ArsR family regulator